MTFITLILVLVTTFVTISSTNINCQQKDWLSYKSKCDFQKTMKLYWNAVAKLESYSDDLKMDLEAQKVIRLLPVFEIPRGSEIVLGDWQLSQDFDSDYNFCLFCHDLTLFPGINDFLALRLSRDCKYWEKRDGDLKISRYIDLFRTLGSLCETIFEYEISQTVEESTGYSVCEYVDVVPVQKHEFR